MKHWEVFVVDKAKVELSSRRTKKRIPLSPNGTDKTGPTYFRVTGKETPHRKRQTRSGSKVRHDLREISRVWKLESFKMLGGNNTWKRAEKEESIQDFVES